MKKLGFTLAEALIALAIVGIIAAIAVPMINRYKPDEDKITFLRTYDSLVETIVSIAGNTQLYPLAATENGSVIDYSQEPLKNKNSVEYEDYTYPSATGNDKFCEILADAFNATSIECTATKLDLTTLNFTTPDGIAFYMKKEDEITDPSTGIITTPASITIMFDINGSEGPNKVYGTDCKKPDRFNVKVSLAGKVIPADGMAEKYLQTRGSYRKTDLVANTTLNANLTNFKAHEMCDNDNFDDNKETCCALDDFKDKEACQEVDPCNDYNPATGKLFDEENNQMCKQQYCNYIADLNYNDDVNEASSCGVCMFENVYINNAIKHWDSVIDALGSGQTEKTAEDFYEELLSSYSGTLSSGEADFTDEGNATSECKEQYGADGSLLKYYKSKIQAYCTDPDHGCLNDTGHF